MIKVTHIVSGDLWAGAEAMVFNLLAGLHKKKDIEIYAILLNERRLSHELRKSGIETYVLDEQKISLLKIVSRLHYIIRKNKPDILHSHRYKENIIAFVNKNFFSSAKLVATQHGMPENFNRNINMRRKILTRVNFFLMKKAFDKIVCVSDDMKKQIALLFGINDDALSVIHNGIIMPAVAALPKPAEFFRIGTAGRIFPVKDFPLFIKIAQRILENNQNVQFLLAGDGPDRNMSAGVGR